MNNNISGYNVSEIESFVGKKGDEYLKRFETVSENKKFTFNWAAAFFGGCWCGYRKMWLEVIVFYIIYSLCTLTISALYMYLVLGNVINEVHPVWLLDLLLRLIVFVISGFIGDRIYWRNIKKRVDFSHLSDEVRNNVIGFKAILKESRGCSYWYGIVPAGFLKGITEGIIILPGTAIIQNWLMSVYR